jgi:hypothetical protein
VNLVYASEMQTQTETVTTGSCVANTAAAGDATTSTEASGSPTTTTVVMLLTETASTDDSNTAAASESPTTTTTTVVTETASASRMEKREPKHGPIVISSWPGLAMGVLKAAASSRAHPKDIKFCTQAPHISMGVKHNARSGLATSSYGGPDTTWVGKTTVYRTAYM